MKFLKKPLSGDVDTQDADKSTQQIFRISTTHPKTCSKGEIRHFLSRYKVNLHVTPRARFKKQNEKKNKRRLGLGDRDRGGIHGIWDSWAWLSNMALHGLGWGWLSDVKFFFFRSRLNDDIF